MFTHTPIYTFTYTYECVDGAAPGGEDPPRQQARARLAARAVRGPHVELGVCALRDQDRAALPRAVRDGALVAARFSRLANLTTTSLPPPVPSPTRVSRLANHLSSPVTPLVTSHPPRPIPPSSLTSRVSRISLPNDQHLPSRIVPDRCPVSARRCTTSRASGTASARRRPTGATSPPSHGRPSTSSATETARRRRRPTATSAPTALTARAAGSRASGRGAFVCTYVARASFPAGAGGSATVGRSSPRRCGVAAGSDPTRRETYVVGEFGRLAKRVWCRFDEALELDEIGLGARYLTAMYWAIATMSSVGGEIAPRSDAERLYGFFAILIGSAAYGFLIGSVASLVSEVGTTGDVGVLLSRGFAFPPLLLLSARTGRVARLGGRTRVLKVVPRRDSQRARCVVSFPSTTVAATRTHSLPPCSRSRCRSRAASSSVDRSANYPARARGGV